MIRRLLLVPIAGSIATAARARGVSGVGGGGGGGTGATGDLAAPCAPGTSPFASAADRRPCGEALR
jgi:hypothetical protein